MQPQSKVHYSKAALLCLEKNRRPLTEHTMSSELESIHRGWKYWLALRALTALGAVLAIGSSCLGEEAPAVETASAVEAETECTAADVSWPPNSTTLPCQGPWIYKRYAVQTSRDPVCGVEGCTQRQVCPKDVPQPPTVTTENRTYPGINCSTESGQTRCEPDSSRAETRCDQFRNEEWTRVDGLPNVTATTKSNDLDRLSPFFGLSHTFRCTATIGSTKRISGRWDTCPCEIPLYFSCPHAINTTVLKRSVNRDLKSWIISIPCEIPAPKS